MERIIKLSSFIKSSENGCNEIDAFGLIEALTRKVPEKSDIITATFKDGTRVEYTSDMVDLLKSDTSTVEIMDNETGEILYTCND